MAETPQPPNDSKALFRECGTCSQTFGHLLDREFGHRAEDYERALSRLAGGIANHGEQCGMLWGATMAVGLEAGRRCDDANEAIATAMVATGQVVASFETRSQTVDCRDITGRNLNTIRGMAGLMLDTFKKGMDDSKCFVLAEDWTPEALQAAKDGLDTPSWHARTPRSCASEVVRAMGGSEEEVVAVAGFGGGMGLRGKGCGALGAAVWKKGLDWVRAHPGKTPGPWTDTGDKHTLKVFEESTDGEYVCEKICGRRFETVDAHTEFLEAGGCKALIDALANS